MKHIAFGLVLCLFVVSARAVAAREPVFLDLSEARDAIVDESGEKYFSRLQPMEMAAKTGAPLAVESLAAQRDATRRRYREGVRDFTRAEKETIRWYVAAIQPRLERAYPALARTPWRFIKVSTNIEGGLPHTRGDNIVLSNAVTKWLRSMKARKRRAEALFRGAELLVHELVHVHQRREPDRYMALYRKDWGFVKAQSIETTAWMRAHQIVNPDGTDATWIYPLRRNGAVRWILPLIVFADGAGPKRLPRDMRMIAVTLQGKNGRYRVTAGGDGGESMVALATVPEYAERFVGISSIYHPNEIAADFASMSFVLDEMIREAQFSTRARQAAAHIFRDQRKLFRRFYREGPSVGARPRQKP